MSKEILDTPQFFEIDLPDHQEEFKKLENFISKIKKQLNIISNQKSLTKDKYTDIWNEISRGLFFIGNLSKPVFNLRDSLEEKYKKTYINSPELAKNLFLKHNQNMNKPYDKYKNRLYKLFNELNALYKKINKIDPPNEI